MNVKRIDSSDENVSKFADARRAHGDLFADAETLPGHFELSSYSIVSPVEITYTRLAYQAHVLLYFALALIPGLLFGYVCWKSFRVWVFPVIAKCWKTAGLYLRG